VPLKWGEKKGEKKGWPKSDRRFRIRPLFFMCNIKRGKKGFCGSIDTTKKKGGKKGGDNETPRS